MTMKFTDLPLCPELQKALAAAEHVTATPIQAATIPTILDGSDLLGCAQTGTGKTAAFALPILERLAAKPARPVASEPEVLILAPTRELAAQISESFRTYGRYLSVRQTAVFGGVNQNVQVRALRRGVHVLVACPGRLLDLIGQGHIRLDRVSMLVLDEADRMMDMGFLPALKKIIRLLPEQRQSLCFSATMPPEVAELAASLLKDPQQISVTPQSTTSRQVNQRVLLVPQGEKRRVLLGLLDSEVGSRVLVFTRTKRRADVVAAQLKKDRVEADAMHGNKTQNARTRALARFRTGRTRVLVATDVAARGIDVDGITHVVNYDLPDEPDSYVHRIGRTGRAGATGTAITFCDPGERRKLKAIERAIGQSLELVGTDGTVIAAERSSSENAPGRRRSRKQLPQRGNENRTRRPGKPAFRSEKQAEKRPKPRRQAAAEGDRTTATAVAPRESDERTYGSARGPRPNRRRRRPAAAAKSYRKDRRSRGATSDSRGPRAE